MTPRTDDSTIQFGVPATFGGENMIGCSACVHTHARGLGKAGENDERIWAVAAWRDAPFFADAERATLVLTEAVTRLGACGDQPNYLDSRTEVKHGRTT